MSNIQRSHVTVPVGDQLSSIKDILEKVNLFSFPADEAKKKDEISIQPDPKDAYLGPKFWDKPITLDSLSEMDEPEFSVMNFNEFLIENDLTMSGSNSDNVMDSSSTHHDDDEDDEDEEEEEEAMTFQDAQKSKGNDDSDTAKTTNNKKKQLFDNDENASFLYVESKRARLEREAEEKRRKKAEEEANLEVSFDPKELSLATIPGSTFDPRKCAFSSDDLKPQPIIRKRKKDFVPTDKKDDHYWEKRKRNNQSARRSREARRLKENQIALRASFLEKENFKLRVSNKELKEENLNLKDTISFLRDKLSAMEK
ncbi:LOW QUALITY PROTEIN: hepatic leukemia factor [Lepeophtheirus salmonis]|uniref:Hepatic leukemia factor n=1 Tax=Lepeophtheirus salmonis TaxID=72036 RepID=D3PI55_LEPSM|nr:LOW QUALITY PROTEIN: thyrotroph embryonic factor-like [Lepeophtheirus salmonis]ADD38241.1 Hepatic leukemia factor [Lepeophtheirus salmonis]